MDLEQLVSKVSNYEFSLFLMILKIFRARVSYDYLAKNNLEIWVCEHHDQPYLFSYPSGVNLMSRWYPRREYSYLTAGCCGWCEIYFESKFVDLNKEDCNCNPLDCFYHFDEDKFVEAPLEIKIICS